MSGRFSSEAPYSLPNLRSEEWRESQKERLRTVLELILLKYSDLIGDELTIKSLKEWYDPSIENAFFLPVCLTSEKVRVYELVWNPLTGELDWIIVMIIPRGEGIGTLMKQMTEEIAGLLQAKTLAAQLIIKEHWQFWKNQRGYVFDEQKHEAVMTLRD